MHKRHTRIVGLTIAALCMVRLLAGCGDDNGGRPDRVKPQAYKDDGYLGMSNTNPGIPGPNMADNYATVADFMTSSIRQVPGVAGTNVTFNGAHAYVTIRLQRGIRPNEVSTAERQAASILRFNFPKYDIHVRSLRQ